MRFSSLSLLLALGNLPVLAQQVPPEDLFAELEAEIREMEAEGRAEEMDEFQQWKANYLAEYQAFREEHFKRLDDIRDKLLSTWGDAEVSTESKYVEYDQAANTKTVVDFEKNEIRVSILHDKDQQITREQAAEALQKVERQAEQQTKALSHLLGQRVERQVAEELVRQASSKEQDIALMQARDQVLEKQIALIEEQSVAQVQQVEKIYDVVNADEVDQGQLTEENIEQQKKLIEQEKQQRIAALRQKAAELRLSARQREALRNKKITTFTIPLSNRNYVEKAQPYVSDVLKQSERWDLSPSLVLAIIHTESYFNPKAQQSDIPAFGLMQIVPRTAGVDVNRFLYQRDEPMAESLLLQPSSNIETGVAYMHILNSRYLSEIKDPLSRTYCVIAAYNTGSGNVAKTFNRDGSRNIKKAAEAINSLTPEQVYQHLVAHLPYDETRHYVQKVTNRQSIYQYVDSI